jgi:hypothetical protein
VSTNGSSPWRWWFLFAAAFILPWLLSIGAHAALMAWLPGVVKTDHWRHFTSLCLLAGGVSAAVLLFGTRLHWIKSLIASGAILLGAILLALLAQMRSTCGDESIYVGRPASEQVASCG